MARKPGRNNSELIEEIARSRRRVARNLRTVREELDLPRKIRQSVRQRPVGWIIGAVAVGLVLTSLTSRKKKIYVNAKAGAKSKSTLLEAGFILGLLRITAGLLKPVIANLVTKKLGSYTGRERSAEKW
jgi:hypothetical protein